MISKYIITDLGKKLLLIIVIQLLILTIVLAANDPGHDTLYIEEDGDSELNGSLNITDNMSVQGGLIRQPGGLILYGDDSIPSPGVNYISGTTGNDIYIDAQGSIYLKWMTSGAVFIGSGPSTVTDLNVSGALYVQGATATVGGINICLENGTNCPSDLGGANITGSGADNRVAFWTDGDTLSYSDNLTWNRSAQRLGIGTTSPWKMLSIEDDSGSTGDVALSVKNTNSNSDASVTVRNSDNGGLSLQATGSGFSLSNKSFLFSEGVEALGIATDGNVASGGAGYIYFKTSGWEDYNERMRITAAGDIGVGTTSPSARLEVNGSSNQLRINYNDTNHGNISVDSEGNMTITANGHVIIDLS